jgi:hypothetical protein
MRVERCEESIISR